MSRCVVISGCSGGGKSTLLEELARRGHAVVAEPGRRIVREALLAHDRAILPWVDAAAFARKAVAVALADRADVGDPKDWTFFDRGLIDAAVALQHATGKPVLAELNRSHRWHRRVFMAPPWPEIYVDEPERLLGFEAARAEYDGLVRAYRRLGYKVSLLPRTDTAARADFVLATLGS